MLFRRRTLHGAEVEYWRQRRQTHLRKIPRGLRVPQVSAAFVQPGYSPGAPLTDLGNQRIPSAVCQLNIRF